MPEILRDARRGLRAAPGTTALAMTILTIGIAAATVTFSVVDAIALRRLPFPEPERLLAIARTGRGSTRAGPVAPQDYYTWQSQVTAFEGLAAHSLGGGWLTLTEGGASERLVSLRVTANLFDVLRVVPALGRGFGSDHEVAGQDLVVILSHETWRNRFGGDPAILGRRLAFGRQSREVIGVMPPGFTYPVGPADATEVYVPHVPRATDRDHGYGGRGFSLLVVGRLRPGATSAVAEAQVLTATANVIAAYPEQSFWKDASPVVTSLHASVVGPARRWLVLLLGAVALVLMIAYVNVANLLLARATRRTQEFAVRTALGASRACVARALVVESVLLSTAAAAAGILLAVWGVQIATSNLPAGLARASTIALDLRVLSVAIGVALGTGMLFGVIPAWHGSRADVTAVMKQGSGAIASGRARWQRMLLVSELAFVVTLLVAAALFITSFVNVLRADLGFSRERLVAFRLSVPAGSAVPTTPRAAAEAFVNDALVRARAVPGVESAAFADGGMPLSTEGARYSVTIPGYGPIRGADMLALRAVTPEYFGVAGIRVVDGRVFDASRSAAPDVAMLNEEAARRFFGGRSPVGQVIMFRRPTTIVGVVASVSVGGPESERQPELYLPLHQDELTGPVDSGWLVVKLAAGGSAQSVRAALTGLSANSQPPAIRDFGEEFRAITADRRFSAALMSGFGVLALLMAAAGVYGLTSFVVGQQTRSIGLRLAIGATTGRIFRGVIADSGRLLAIGLLIGVMGGWAASRLFSSEVFGVTGGEPWLYAAVAATLGLTSIAAMIVPAWRASRVDPLVALRAE
jgi:predicted permease